MSAVRCFVVYVEYGLEPTVTDAKHPNANTDPTCAAVEDVMAYACFMYVGTNKRNDTNTMSSDRDVKCNQKLSDATCLRRTPRSVGRCCCCSTILVFCESTTVCDFCCVLDPNQLSSIIGKICTNAHEPKTNLHVCAASVDDDDFTAEAAAQFNSNANTENAAQQSKLDAIDNYGVRGSSIMAEFNHYMGGAYDGDQQQQITSQ